MTEHERLLVDNLRDTLRAADLIASRFAASRAVVASLLPLDAGRLAALDRHDGIEIDAYLLQFLQLASLLQDKLTRLILRLSSEDLERASRLDMRRMMEKLGALDPSREFGAIAEIRNRLAHDYPLQPERKVRSIEEAFRRGEDLLDGFADMFDFANAKFLSGGLARGG